MINVKHAPQILEYIKRKCTVSRNVVMDLFYKYNISLV